MRNKNIITPELKLDFNQVEWEESDEQYPNEVYGSIPSYDESFYIIKAVLSYEYDGKCEYDIVSNKEYYIYIGYDDSSFERGGEALLTCDNWQEVADFINAYENKKYLKALQIGDQQGLLTKEASLALKPDN